MISQQIFKEWIVAKTQIHEQLEHVTKPHEHVTKPDRFLYVGDVFNATSLPNCASFWLIQVAEDNTDEFDEVAVETVKPNFYVKDCTKSVETDQEAIG